MAHSATLEVGIRYAYWHVSPLHQALAGSTQPPGDYSEPAQGLRDHPADLLNRLQENGISRGSLLLMHSSDDAVAHLGFTPTQFNDLILQHLGPSGSLVVPTFPIYKDEPSGLEWMRGRVAEKPLVFDARRTVPWTGLQGFDLMRRKESRRSLFPINTLTAIGPAANMMFARELEPSLPTACGPGSAWFYCVEHGAKVLMIGLDVAHSMTLNHVAEDAFEEQWPVSDWYRRRRFRLLASGMEIDLVARERRPRWAVHYAEGRLNADMQKAGVVTHLRVGGVECAVLDARQYLHFLFSKRQVNPTYPYFLIPTRRLKGGNP